MNIIRGLLTAQSVRRITGVKGHQERIRENLKDIGYEF
jgi:hypothetical protein